MVSQYPNRKYRLWSQMVFQTRLRGVTYSDPYVSILPNGKVWLGNGICSDGCSPTYRVGDKLIGIWNGPASKVYKGMPITCRAFFLHDALLERRKTIGISAKAIHREFEREIKASGFILAGLYSWFVHKFGPTDA